MTSKFPLLVQNETGWGPSTEIQDGLYAPHLKYVPFQVFSKTERVSRPADWSTTSHHQYGYRQRDNQFSSSSGLKFAEEEDLSEFHLVEVKTSNRNKIRSIRSRNFRYQAGGRSQGSAASGQRSKFTPHMKRPNSAAPSGRATSGGSQQYTKRGDRSRLETSINILADWGDALEVFEFTKLSKIPETQKFPTYSESEESSILMECGKVGILNSAFGPAITPQKDKSLARNFTSERNFLKITSSEDPNMRAFFEQNKADVFITDSILTSILTMVRSIYSWDVFITKKDGKYWFDKRPESRIDTITVNENSSSGPSSSSESTPTKLSEEANLVQNNFSQQVLVKDTYHSLRYTSPFASNTKAAPEGYRYRILPLGKLKVLCRFTLDAAKIETHEETDSEGNVVTVERPSYVSVKTFTEHGSSDWRKRLETQRGAVLATELKSNVHKIQRWALQALLAGSSTIDVGFVTRQIATNPTVHTILYMQSYSPNDFLSQMTVSKDQLWSIFHHIIQRLEKEPDGKYLLFKDPATPNVKLFRLPQTATLAKPEGITQAAPPTLVTTSQAGGMTAIGLAPSTK